MCMGFFWFCFFLQISTYLLDVSINLQFYTRLFRAMEIITDRIKKTELSFRSCRSLSF